MRAEAKHVEARGPRSVIRRAAALALVLVCAGCDTYNPNEVFDYRCKKDGVIYPEMALLRAAVDYYLTNHSNITFHYGDKQYRYSIKGRYNNSSAFLWDNPQCCFVGRSPPEGPEKSSIEEFGRQNRRAGLLAGFVEIEYNYAAFAQDGSTHWGTTRDDFEVGNCLEVRRAGWPPNDISFRSLMRDILRF
jgi:hypothetical protein